MGGVSHQDDAPGDEAPGEPRPHLERAQHRVRRRVDVDPRPLTDEPCEAGGRGAFHRAADPHDPASDAPGQGEGLDDPAGLQVQDGVVAVARGVAEVAHDVAVRVAMRGRADPGVVADGTPGAVRRDDQPRPEGGVHALLPGHGHDVVPGVVRGDDGDAPAQRAREPVLEVALQDLLGDGLRHGEDVRLLAREGREGHGTHVPACTPGDPVPDPHPARAQVIGDAAGFERTQGRRVDADGPRMAAALHAAFQHDGVEPGPPQQQGGVEADGPAADHDHVMHRRLPPGGRGRARAG